MTRWLALALLLVALPCRADEQRVHLTWSAPVASMCPVGATLRADVEALTGLRFVEDASDADVRVVGRIERGEGGVVAQLTAHTADGAPLGTRELRAGGEECATLRKPLAMVLALLLDEPLPSRPALPLAFGVELAGDTHMIPSVTGGVGLLAFALPLAWLGVRLQLDYWWPRVAETYAGAGAKLSALGGTFSLCPRLVAGAAVSLWACGGVQAGALFAAPRGLIERDTKALAFADALLELSASWRIGRAALWTSAGPLLALTRPELYFARADAELQRIHRATTWGAIFRVGLTIGSAHGHGR